MHIVQLYSGQTLSSGDFVYRIQQPCDGLNEHIGVKVTNVDLLSVVTPEPLVRAPLLVLHHLTDPDLLPVVRERRSQGRPTVYELADDFRHSQSHRSDSANGASPDYQAVIETLMRRCDAVQTTGPELAQRYRRLNRNTVVFPNLIRGLRKDKPAVGGSLTIGWGGSARHLQDLAVHADSLIAWVKQHPDVRLAIMGAAEIHALFAGKLPPNQLRLTAGGSMHAYREFLDDLDIGIAPLLPTEFNACRSDVKFLEYAAAGVVPVCSAYGPYLHLPDPGKMLLLFKTPAELVTQLETLRRSDVLRQNIARRAQDWVEEHRSATEKNWRSRIETYARMVTHQEQAFSVDPGELDPQVAIELKRGIDARDPEVSQRALAALCDRHPKNYQVAYFYGWALSRVGRYHAAIEVLSRAIRLHPASIRTAQLLAQTQVLVGDPAGAGRTLKPILRVEPRLSSVRQLYCTVMAVRNQVENQPTPQISYSS